MDRERIHINTAKIKKGGENFEIVIDPDLAINYKNKKPVDVKDIMKSEHIFSDAKKGQLASEEHMISLFNTKEPEKVAEIILQHGELQLTKEYRSKQHEDKVNKIMDIIQRNGVDPKTKLPHPRVRIQNAFDEAKIKLDFYKSAEDQVQDVLNHLRKVLPISFETIKVEVKIGAKHARNIYGVVSSYGKIMHDTWLEDGIWLAVIEIPAGVQNDFYDKLNALTHGDVSTKIVK